MWLLKRVGAPSVSPNGKLVIVSVTEPSYDDKEQTSDLWILPTDGSKKPRRLTATKGGESSIEWSPDGTKIAFAAKREGDETSQIYILNITESGEAQRFTNLSTGAFSPKWRPDGKALLFQSFVFPNALDDSTNKKIAADRKARKYKARVYESFPIRYWDRWLDDMQTHIFVQGLEPSTKARDILAGTELVKQSGFAGVPGNSGADLQAAWTPDGQNIIFTATTDRAKAAFSEVVYHLWQIPSGENSSKQEPKRLTSGNNSYGGAKFSPKGKLFALMNPANDKVYNHTRLVEISPASGAATPLTASFDRSVGDFECTEDGTTIIFSAEDTGLLRLFSVPSAGGEVKPLLEQSVGCYNGFSLAENVLVAQFETATMPNEVVKIDLPQNLKGDAKARKHLALTDFNGEALAKLDLAPLRHFTFTSKGGKIIHSMMALPPAFDETKKYPLLVIMHGGPHTMFRDAFSLRWNYHLLAQPGYVVLLTNYTGSTGFSEKFAQEIQGDPFITPANEINEAADEAIKRFSFVDASRQACGGASYGGHLANWMQATTTRYKCLIAHAGLINLESQWGTSDGIYHREINNGGPVWEQGKTWREQNPIRFAKNFKTPILLTVGENDFRVPLNQTLENWSVLQRLQIPSKLIVFPDANHWILKGEDHRYWTQEVQAWLKKHLGN
jgi:dipeptidyl aminopeptidase/acylaminoacyl peptidase